MDYNTFCKLLTDKKQLTSNEIIVFVKLPEHQRNQLFRLACTDSSVINAQLLLPRIHTSENFWKELLPTLLLTKKIPPENLNWMLSFNPCPDLGKKYMNIMNTQSAPVWEIIFSCIPFNSNKIARIMSYCVQYQLSEALDWIIEQQKNQRLPFHYEMLYLNIYNAFCEKKKLMMKKLIQSLSICSNNELDLMKSHLSYPSFQFTQYSIKIENKLASIDKIIFSDYLTNAINQELFIRLNNDLPTGETITKYHKI